MPRRLLIATPVRSGFSVNYWMSSRSILDAIPPSEIKIDWLPVAGAPVNFARNEIAYEAIQGDYDDLLQIDDDMAPTPEHVRRILSHDVDVVGGCYCAKKFGKPKWLFVPQPGAVMRQDGLLECAGVATGFERTKVSALRKLYAHYHDRRFLTPPDEKGYQKEMCELFPMGLIGEGTPEGRLERIKAVLARQADDPQECVRQVKEIATSRAGPGRLLGEDYFFTRLCRKAGVISYVDLGIGPVAHIGNVPFPITPDKVGHTDGGTAEMPPSHEI
jgi:hypothetical protein